MQQALRFLGICLFVCVFAAGQAEAATVTIAWDPNTEPDLARYFVGYRTSPGGTETLVNVGNVTTWSLTTAVAGQTYFFRVYAENSSGLRSAPSNEVTAIVPTTPPPPTGGGLALERGRVSFGAVKSGSTVTQATPSQRLQVTQTASGSVSWTASASASWISVSPASGTGSAGVTVSLQAGSLSPGVYNGSVTVRPAGTNTNLVVQVQARVYATGASGSPAGVIDTPPDGVSGVSGAIPVTGWAVDDIAVGRIDIYRDAVGAEGSGQIFLGNAAFISGSRPDVENLYPDAPLNYRGGWGFMVLTNMLPDQFNGRPTGGNGTFRVHAYAIDFDGHASYLGSKRFNANNSAATRPFGSIDTPTQGGTASGNAFIVFGWAISPRATIPTNGSTITVYVDGNPVGHPTYNQFRQDIATAFPGYANSNGAVGYYILNTTQLSNGTHTISWVVTDTQGNSEGIGSRYFTVQNGGSGAMTAAAVASSTVAEGTHGAAVGQSAESIADVQPDYSTVEVKKVASEDPTPQMVYPESTGAIQVKSIETQHIEVRLANQWDEAGGVYEGYLVGGETLRALPVGSTLNKATGVFMWQPGPGFIGTYELVFVRRLSDGSKTRIPVTVTISPKFDK